MASSSEYREYLEYLTYSGAFNRYECAMQPSEFMAVEATLPDDDPTAVVMRRIAHELAMIAKTGYDSYFLIVADLVRFCRENNIPVGPGRGSVCGSCVAYCLGITDIDPITFGIPFERFINDGRLQMPDIDLDVCQYRREEAIQYLRDTYGDDHVAQIITFGTMQAKGVIRDVCRVLHVDDILYGVPTNATGDKLAKMIPEGSGADQVNLEDFVGEGEAGIAFFEEIGHVTIPFEGRDVSVFDTALRLEGLRRNSSVHAAGVVIGDRPLAEIVPLYRRNQKAEIQIQFDYRDAEEIGLLKLDVLGLRTMSVIGEVESLVRDRYGPFDIRNAPLDDEETFKLLQAGDTVGVFQLEGEGITNATKGVEPDRLEDIIALIALYRPGPMEQLGSYIDRKHGKEDVSYVHDDLEPILSRTYGLIVYQEQVMGIASTLAGYSPEEADSFRKAIGKKLPELIKEEVTRFIDRAEERGYERPMLEQLGNQIAYFGRYGFNLGHATGYGFITYWTAFLKAHFPVEFYTANLNSFVGDIDRISIFARDAQKHGIEIRPPDVNKSGLNFTPGDGNEILFGLGAVKGLGSSSAIDIIEERDSAEKNKYTRVKERRVKPDGREYTAHVVKTIRVKNTPRKYDGFVDFCRRLTHIPVNVKENLIKVGAFELDLDRRARLLTAAKDINKEAKKKSCSLSEDAFLGVPGPHAPTLELLSEERTILGIYASEHPLDKYRDKLGEYIVDGSFHDHIGSVKVAGIVSDVRSHMSKRGEMAWVKLETGVTDLPEATMFSDTWKKYSKIVEKGAILKIHGVRKYHKAFGWGWNVVRVERL